MNKLDPLAPSIIKQAAVIQKAIAKVVKLQAKQTVNNALHYRNGPNTTLVYDLPLNSKVLVWRKSGSWNGPYCLLAIKNKMYCIQFPSGPTSFRNTFVKPYFWPKTTHDIEPDELEVITEPDKLEATAEPDKLEVTTKLNKLEITAELDKLEAPAKSDKLKALLPILEVPQEPTEPIKPIIKRS